MSKALPSRLRAPHGPQPGRHGMTNDEIARALGISRQAVNHTLQKALAKVRRELRRRGIEASDLF